jgi:hypothetical protein
MKYSMDKRLHPTLDAIANAIEAAEIGDCPNKAEAVLLSLVMNGWQVTKKSRLTTEE